MEEAEYIEEDAAPLDDSFASFYLDDTKAPELPIPLLLRRVVARARQISRVRKGFLGGSSGLGGKETHTRLLAIDSRHRRRTYAPLRGRRTEASGNPPPSANGPYTL